MFRTQLLNIDNLIVLFFLSELVLFSSTYSFHIVSLSLLLMYTKSSSPFGFYGFTIARVVEVVWLIDYFIVNRWHFKKLRLRFTTDPKHNHVNQTLWVHALKICLCSQENLGFCRVEQENLESGSLSRNTTAVSSSFHRCIALCLFVNL